MSELEDCFRISEEKSCWEGHILLANPLATLYKFRISFKSFNLKYAAIDIFLDD
jgi:hypothetical protein